MGIAVKVTDKTHSGDILSESMIELFTEIVTVKQLIHSRVTQEVEKLDYKCKADTVKLCGEELLISEFQLGSKKELDLEKCQKAAIHAFQSNNYFLLIDNKQVTCLEEAILVSSTTEITFLKLIPLAGG